MSWSGSRAVAPLLRGDIRLSTLAAGLPPLSLRFPEVGRATRLCFLRELCHIKQLDHSPLLWELLRQLEQDYEDLEAEVRKANRYVDQWVMLW
jgi:hypothetical protein